MSNGTPIPRVGKIEGIWYKEVINAMGYKQWVACDASLGSKIAQVSQDNVDLRLVNRETMAVNKLLHLVNGILPDDFIAYLRHEAEAITGHELADGMVVEANGNVVEVSVHISLSLENA